jgi:hypothetical protein
MDWCIHLLRYLRTQVLASRRIACRLWCGKAGSDLRVESESMRCRHAMQAGGRARSACFSCERQIKQSFVTSDVRAPPRLSAHVCRFLIWHYFSKQEKLRPSLPLNTGFLKCKNRKNVRLECAIILWNSIGIQNGSISVKKSWLEVAQEKWLEEFLYKKYKRERERDRHCALEFSIKFY